MKRKLSVLICILIIIASVFGAGTALAVDRTDPPGGYVITDGTTYYWIDYDELIASYPYYRSNPNSEEARLTKFYFDTLGDVVAYVSRVTTKFVSYEDILNTYPITKDIDVTYIWFNSSNPADATPAFDVTTEVMVVGPDATITGSVFVGDDGYIIELSHYEITTTAPSSTYVDIPQQFTVTTTGDETGSYGCDVIYRYEITGGNYTLEYNDGGVWHTLTGGYFGPSGGFEITPDWNETTQVRFTPHNSGDYNMTLRLETTSGNLIAEKTHFINVMHSGIIIPGFKSLTIDANQTNVYLNLYNPSANTCCFVISLVLEDGTVLHQSNILDPGEVVGNAVISQPMPRGYYNAIVRYEAFDPYDLSPLNNAEIEITLIAK